MNLIKASTTVLASTALLLAVSGSARAKDEPPKLTPEEQAEMDAYMKAGTPGPQHMKLAESVGSYDLKVKSWHDPKQPPMEEGGTATRTMALDGRVLVEEFHGSMMGQPFTGHGMTGYDNVTGKYWGTWMDSMSTGMMLSSGSCDAKNTCTFTGSWPDPITKKEIKSRMVTRWTSPTTEIFEMYGPDKAGKEFKMMEITYSRK